MSITRNNITLGEKIRLVNYLVENKEKLKNAGLRKLVQHVKVALNIDVTAIQLSKTYRPEAGYPPLRADTRPAQQEKQDRIEALEKRVIALELQMSKIEDLWK